MMQKTALVVGASGITGSHIARKLISEGWTTYGLARNPVKGIENLLAVSADLLDRKQLTEALDGIFPTHVFFTSWLRNDTEAENIRVNGTMVRNLLSVLSERKSLVHVALVTGLKHYLGPFDAYAKAGTFPQTPVREEHPRLDIQNFYYAQEDEVYAAAAKDGFGWSIHRPHTVIGMAVGNAMNMGTTLAVYASICAHTGRPFHFPGSAAQWNGLSDVTDARLLADHLFWAATTPAARNQAFNVANGDVFRWSWLWTQLAGWFRISAEGFNGVIHPLETEMAQDQKTWDILADKNDLVQRDLKKLASPWHTDLDLGRPIEVMTDMANSRKLGFTGYQDTRDSFFDLFSTLKTEKLIP